MEPERTINWVPVRRLILGRQLLDGTYRMAFSICRFRIVQHDTSRGDVRPDQPTDARTGYAAPRVSSNVLRVVRDTALGRHVKSLYAYRCQVCGIRLECEGGPYAEAAHVRPFRRPHDGPDELSNVLALCPNHHVLFDNGAFSIADDLSLIGLPGGLTWRLVTSMRLIHATSPTTVGSGPARGGIAGDDDGQSNARVSEAAQ